MRNLLIAGLLMVLTTFSVHAQTLTDYSIAYSTGSFTATVGGTTVTSGVGTLNDGYVNGIPIGFDFFYMGQRYTTVSVSTNGWLSLGSNISSAAPLNNLSTGGTRPVIAPLWDDLAVINFADASYLVSGSGANRVFTLQVLNNRWNATAAGPTISYQVKLYEASGKIEFIYRQDANVVSNGSASVGITASGTGSGNFISLFYNGGAPTASATTENTTNAVKPPTGFTYTFTPPVPAAPSSLTFTSIGTTGYTLNWIDNSTIETGYAIYRSTDGSNFTFVNKTAANATSSAQTGLTPGTLYYWRVFAVSEGALSSALQSSAGTVP
ncbi:MAG: fibronectin type III domain-containing protein, partial [Sphingobacteriales bacterium]